MTDRHVIVNITRQLAEDPEVCRAAVVLSKGGSSKNRTDVMRMFAELGVKLVEEGGIVTGLRLTPDQPSEVQYARELMLRAATVPNR